MILKVKDLWKGVALNFEQFEQMMLKIFPEISIIHYRRFSKEANLLIKGAIKSIFNAFDTDGSQRLTMEKLKEGFKVFCEISPVIDGEVYFN